MANSLPAAAGQSIDQVTKPRTAARETRVTTWVGMPGLDGHRVEGEVRPPQPRHPRLHHRPHAPVLHTAVPSNPYSCILHSLPPSTIILYHFSHPFTAFLLLFALTIFQLPQLPYTPLVLHC